MGERTGARRRRRRGAGDAQRTRAPVLEAAVRRTATAKPATAADGGRSPTAQGRDGARHGTNRNPDRARRRPQTTQLYGAGQKVRRVPANPSRLGTWVLSA